MYAASLVAAVPATIAIATLGGFKPLRMAPDSLFQLYLNVALLGLVIGTVFLLIEAGRMPALTPGPAAAATASELPPEVSTAPAEPDFFDRLPPDWNGELTALEMEDHYLRAHRADGRSLLLLMRMADAERELAAVDGRRVHRSWWVARGAVRRAARSGRNWALHLEGGLIAPVARDRVGALRQDGWL